MLSTVKRLFLFTVLALTGLAAVLIALAVFRSGRSPEALDWAVKGALAHGLLLLVSFAAYTALDRPACRILALFGMFLASLMLLALPVYIWWEITDTLGLGLINHLAHFRMERLMETGLLTAALLCLIPFILIPRMKRVGRIVQYTTILYLSVAYYFTLLKLWQLNSQRLEEAVATLLIPAGACMLGVFALHKFFEIRAPASYTSLSPAVQLLCPRCFSAQTLGLGDSRCSHCCLKISIAVEEPTCPNCHFNLHNLTRPLCPECGHHLDSDDVPSPERVLIPIGQAA